MAFNNQHYNKYAKIRDPLELLSMWIALEKDFIPLFQTVRNIGGESLIKALHELMATGNANVLGQLSTNPKTLNDFVAKTIKKEIDPEQLQEMTKVVSSLSQMLNSVVNTDFFGEIVKLISTKNREAFADQLVSLSEDQLSELFSDAIIAELDKNPGLISVLRSERTGTGYAAGLPNTRMLSDAVGNQAYDTLANYSYVAANFMNTLTYLLHGYAMSRNNIGKLVPGVSSDIAISGEQNFAFFAMCSTGADVDSPEAQADVARWIDATETVDTSDDIKKQFETQKPGEKAKEWVLNLANLVGKDNFKKYGKDYDRFLALYNILSSKPSEKNWGKSGLSELLAQSGFSPEEIYYKFYNKGKEKNIPQVLLDEIPQEFHILLHQATSINKMNDEQKAIYLERYPDAAAILDNKTKDVTEGQKIRTAQLMILKRSVTQAWAGHIKRYHDNIKQEFPMIDEDSYVRLMSLNDPAIARKEMADKAKEVGLTPAMIDSLVNAELGAQLRKYRDIILQKIEQGALPPTVKPVLGKIVSTANTLDARNSFIQDLGINDIDKFNEMIGQKEQLTKLGNLFQNMPPVADLWSQSKIFNGKEIIDRNYVKPITRFEILQAAGYNPLSVNKNLKDAVSRYQDESIEQYKERMADVLECLIDTGELYTEEQTEYSKLSSVVHDRVNSDKSALIAIHNLLNKVLREELNESGNTDLVDEIDSDDDTEETTDAIESPKEVLSFETLKLERMRILKDLIARTSIPSENIGSITTNVDSVQNKVDPLFAEADLKTDSDFSAAVLDIFRTNFNLPICSYEIETNSPKECKINANGFKLDFSLLVDKYDYETGLIEPTILLAGEAFGYSKDTGRYLVVDEAHLPADSQKDRDRILKQNLKMLAKYQDGIQSADGQWKIEPSGDGKLLATYPDTQKNGETVTVENVDADRYVEYNIRSSFKKPYETFLAHTMKADTIFVDKFDPHNANSRKNAIESIATQLEKLSVLWISSNNDMSNSVKYLKQLHAANQPLPKYAEKYVGETIVQPYSNQQLYGKTLLAHFDIQNIIVPLYNANPAAFDIQGMVDYRKEYNELTEALSKTTDVNQKRLLINRINNLQRRYAKIRDLYDQFVNDIKIFPKDSALSRYQSYILDKRRQIEAIIEDANTKSIGEIHNEIIGGLSPLFNRKSIKNRVSYKNFPPDIYSERAASSRWWNIR